MPAISPKREKESYLIRASRVVRWNLCEKFSSHLYHSRLSDMELDDFITFVYSQLDNKLK